MAHQMEKVSSKDTGILVQLRPRRLLGLSPKGMPSADTRDGCRLAHSLIEDRLPVQCDGESFIDEIESPEEFMAPFSGLVINIRAMDLE